MTNLFSSHFFKENRRQLRKQIAHNEPIVITANGLLQRSSDNSLPFHQDSNFWYLTGIDEPDFVLVISTDSEFLIAPELSNYQNIFAGLSNLKKLSHISDVAQILTGRAGWDRVAELVKKSKRLATCTPAPAYLKSHGMYTNPARSRLVSRLKRLNHSLEITDVRPSLLKQRKIKQPAEISAIRRAVELTSQAFTDISNRQYKYEYEIEADLTRTYHRVNTLHAYDPIVATGKNACTLHYTKNNAMINSGELTLIDSAAEVSHYAADITRVFAFAGPPTKRQLDIYDAVRSVQEFAINLQKPGASIKQNEKRIEKIMGQKLKELGLIKTVNTANVRSYFPHATSHFLGLDVHDVGDFNESLKTGMVITVEPGIYIPDEGIGVRIEDDVLITAKNHEVLSRKLSRALV